MSAKRNMSRLLRLLVVVASWCVTTIPMNTPDAMDSFNESIADIPQSQLPFQDITTKKIHDIRIIGNILVPDATILAKIPYHAGDIFKPQRSRLAIKTLYGLGSLSNIQLSVETISKDEVILYITVEEKKQITDFVFSGNSHLKRDEIEKKIKLSDIKALDENDLINITQQIKKLYGEKDYHHVAINAYLESSDSKAIAHFDIQEGSRTHVQRVFTQGNQAFSNKKLRSLLFTREDWVLGFLNKAGSFQPDALDYDKSVIENFYQNHGFLAAQVSDVIVDPVPNSSDVNVTFCIDEGDLYTIESVKAPGNAILSEEELLGAIAIRPGQIYSKELIRQTLESLRLLWGEYGYIYAEVDPSVIPDEVTKKVQVEFHTSLGNRMTLRRINLTGNRKTRDKVIRRQILLDEGELLTTRKLELSKERVQSIGYFDPRNGVNWKIIKLDEERADLELLLQEIKTGSFYAQIGTGGVVTDKYSPADTFRVNGGMQDTNFLGYGIQINANVSLAKQERSIDFSIANSWLFDRPLYGGLNFFQRRTTFDDFNGTITGPPSELGTGLYGQLGFAIGVLTGTPFSQLAGTNALAEAGFEKVHFNPVQAAVPELQPLFNRKFASGQLLRIGLSTVQDLRNHPVMPNRGIIWNAGVKFGIPHSAGPFGFMKWELDAQWYTPLVNEYDLILRLHGFLGFITIFDNKTIPYRELFNIGGPATVRGFNYGQISPTFVNAQHGIHDPLGGKKAFVINAELIFPITADAGMRGVVFYDGGAGWDTPNRGLIPFGLRNDNFNYRHAIGFGIRLTRPSPVRIDVGFKLDRRRRLGESASEVHFTMAQDF